MGEPASAAATDEVAAPTSPATKSAPVNCDLGDGFSHDATSLKTWKIRLRIVTPVIPCFLRPKLR
jgi:hypothetical protein